MTFIITKVISYLIVPPASLFIIIAAGFIVIRFHRGLGKTLVAAGFILLYLLSTNPVSDALLKPLETSALLLKNEHIQADAIVVLGGGVIDLSQHSQPSEPSESSLARTIKGITLYRKRHLPLVLVGGSGDPSRTVTPDADAMKRTARELGIPAKDIIVENKSRNTIEGARALKRLLKGKRIILVTSAYHMKRAAAMFKKQGFEVFPAPAHYISERRKLSLYSFIPHAAPLNTSSAAIAEYISLFWYAINGDI